jgi:polar amino acid transport system substrate-binding protein
MQIRRRPLRLLPVAAGLAFVLAGTACSSSGGETQVGSAKPTGITQDASLHALLPPDLQKSGTIVVGTNAPYPPYENFASPGSQKIVGLDVDLGNAIGDVLGVKLQFQQQPFDGLVPGVQAGKYSLLMAAAYDTKAREKVIDFVDYGTSGYALVVMKGNPDKLQDFLSMCGQKIAAQSGTTSADLINAKQSECTAAGKPKIELQTYSQYSDAQLALTSGKVVAAVPDYPTAAYTIQQQGANGPLEIVKNLDLFGPGSRAVIGIGVAKNHSGLAKAIQGALQVLSKSGVYTQLNAHYGLADFTLTDFTVNGAKS